MSQHQALRLLVTSWAGCISSLSDVISSYRILAASIMCREWVQCQLFLIDSDITPDSHAINTTHMMSNILVLVESAIVFGKPWKYRRYTKA